MDIYIYLQIQSMGVVLKAHGVSYQTPHEM